MELLPRDKFSFQRMVFAKPTDAKHAEPQHMPLFIYLLHDGIMCRGAHETRCLTELDFKVITFRVEPYFYFLAKSVTVVR